MYQISVPTLNTFSYEEAIGYSKQGDYKIEKVQKIQVNTVNKILDLYNDNVFPNFLSLNAEGIDEIVLQSIDYKDNLIAFAPGSLTASEDVTEKTRDISRNWKLLAFGMAILCILSLVRWLLGLRLRLTFTKDRA